MDTYEDVDNDEDLDNDLEVKALNQREGLLAKVNSHADHN